MRTNGAFLRTSFDSPRRAQQTSSPIPSSSQGGAGSSPGEAIQENPHTALKQENHAASQSRTAPQQLTHGQAYQDRSTPQEQVTKPKLPNQHHGPRKIQTKAIIEHQSIRNRPLPAIPTDDSDENKNPTPKTASPAKRNEPPSLVKSNHQILTRAELQQHIQSQLNVIYWTTSSSSG
jgi:hypothetical protein